MATMQITVRKDGLVKGSLGNLLFTALVFDEPSEYGIDGGRTSKLFIYEERISPSTLIAAYDRKWQKKVTNAMQTQYTRIRQALENLVTEAA